MATPNEILAKWERNSWAAGGIAESDLYELAHLVRRLRDEFIDDTWNNMDATPPGTDEWQDFKSWTLSLGAIFLNYDVIAQSQLDEIKEAISEREVSAR